MHPITAIAALFVVAAGDSPSVPSGGDHDTLYGVLFTGAITLILGVLTIRSGSRRLNNSNKDDPRDEEIKDLKKQRDKVQTKFDTSQEVVGKQGLEIARLRELCISHDIDPDSPPVNMPHRRPQPHEAR